MPNLLTPHTSVANPLQVASVLCHHHPPVLHLTSLGHLDKEETRLVSSDLHAPICLHHKDPAVEL
jgi:hypothetical protein